MVVSKGMSFLRNTWCCATGVKLGTCLARITLWLHPPLKILACLSLSRVVLLHRIKILYNLILLQSCRELSQEHSAPTEDSDSPNESGSESMVSWEVSPALPLEDTSPVSLKDQATPKAASWESDSNVPVKENQIFKDAAKIKKQKTKTATTKRLKTL